MAVIGRDLFIIIFVAYLSMYLSRGLTTRILCYVPTLYTYTYIDSRDLSMHSFAVMKVSSHTLLSSSLFSMTSSH